MRRRGIRRGAKACLLALAASAALALPAQAQRSLDEVDTGRTEEPATADSQPVPDGQDDLDAVDADTPAPAADAARDADDAAPAPDDGDERAAWARRAAEARMRVEKARARVKAAEDAYQNMRQRNYPRGEAKDAIVAEVEASKKALAAAEARLQRLGESARDADVPPAWIEPD